MAHWTYYHNLDPFIWKLTENFGLRWYSMAYILGAVSTYFLAIYLIKKGRLHLPLEKVMDIVTWGVMGLIIGGRLGYCAFYQPYLFLSLDTSFPFWGVLKIHEGGMASHGGILGLFASLWLFSYKYKVSLFALADASAIGGSVGLFLGRIANFINGELYGRVVEQKALLGVKFPSELFLWVNDISTYKDKLLDLSQVLPALEKVTSLKVQFFPSLMDWQDWVSQAVASPVYRNKVAYFSQLIIQFSSSPSVQKVLEPLLFVRHPSQLYQAFLGGLLPFLIISVIWLKPRRAGLISFVWFFLYLFFRVISESFRMPDFHIGYQFLDLTRGQWLSLFGFFILAIYGFFVFFRVKERKS